MSACVLDASALLAWLHEEPGAELVQQRLGSALVSTVNWSEVLQKSIQRGAEVTGMRADLAELGISFEAFTTPQAELAAQLWSTTRSCGLSLGDRACIALGIERRLPVLTTDRIWADLGLDADIVVVR